MLKIVLTIALAVMIVLYEYMKDFEDSMTQTKPQEELFWNKKCAII